MLLTMLGQVRLLNHFRGTTDSNSRVKRTRKQLANDQYTAHTVKKMPNFYAGNCKQHNKQMNTSKFLIQKVQPLSLFTMFCVALVFFQFNGHFINFFLIRNGEKRRTLKRL